MKDLLNGRERYEEMIDHRSMCSLRTQTYFRLSVVSAEPVTAGNTSVFAGYSM